MMNRIKHIGIVGLVASFLFSSCETDVDVNGPYKKIPIVTGLLDINDSIHFVKITKTFTNGKDGNAQVISGIADSSYFETVDAQIDVVLNNSVIQTYQLKDTVLMNKDTNGLFYAPEQKLYYFVDYSLTPDATYKLKLNLDEGDIESSAETELISGVSISTPSPINPTFNFASANSSETGNYSTQSVIFNGSENGTVYGLTFRMYYDEYYTDSQYESKYFTWNLGNITNPNLNSNADRTFRLTGDIFYQQVEDNVPDDPNVTKRLIRGIELRMAVGTEELQTYIEVSEPVTGVVQNKPEYTNIENGRGIFSSRNVFSATGYKMNKNSLKELCMGQYTGSKKFKVDTQTPGNEVFDGTETFFD